MMNCMDNEKFMGIGKEQKKFYLYAIISYIYMGFQQSILRI